MPDTLLLCPVPVPRETFWSFLSRMATMNRVTMANFASDMGFSAKRASLLTGNATQAVAKLAGLDDDGLAEIVSWSGKPDGGARMLYRGEILVSRAIRNPQMRGCPVCLRDDVEANPGAPLEAMAMRGDWQFRGVSICVRHHHPLVPLWEAERLTDRFDTGARLGEIVDQVLSNSLDQPRDVPNPYDLWLDGRLQHGRDATWLASQSLHAATNFCRLLGTELLRQEHGQLQHPPPEHTALRAAQAAGFEVAAQGEAAIKAAFDQLAERAGAATDSAQKAFGQIFIKFRNDYKNDPDFDQLRKILRDSILENWAIAEGEVVLGEIVTERRLHSVYTAAKEVGTTKARLAQLLVEVGAVAEDDTRPPHRRVFDARKYAPFIAAVASMASLRDLRKAMGASRNEIDALIEEGLLAPAATIPGLRSCWSLTDGLRLVEEVRALADPLPQRATGWESLLAAKNRSLLAISDILQGLRDGQFRAGLSPVKPGFSGVYVAKFDINRLARSLAPEEAATLLPAAAFGISIGINGKGRFIRLVKAGHTPATFMKHPQNGVARFYMSEDDIAAFHRRFVTISTLAIDRQQHHNSIRSALKAAGLRPFSPDGEDFGCVYLRAEVAAAL